MQYYQEFISDKKYSDYKLKKNIQCLIKLMEHNTIESVIFEKCILQVLRFSLIQ